MGDKLEKIQMERNFLLITGILIVAIIIVLSSIVLDIPNMLGLGFFGGEAEETQESVETQIKQEPIIKEIEEKPEEKIEEPIEVELKEQEEFLKNKISIKINQGEETTKNTRVELLLKAEDITKCKLWNENQDYFDVKWFDFKGTEMKVSWDLTTGKGDKEVFFQCKNEEDKLTSLVSAQIYYDKEYYPSGSGGSSRRTPSQDVPDTRLPTDLTLTLQGTTQEYTLEREIEVFFSVNNADYCEIYEEKGLALNVPCEAQKVDFILTTGDELKTIYFKAKRGVVERVISKDIILMQNKPAKPSPMRVVNGDPYFTLLFTLPGRELPFNIDYFEIYRREGFAPDETAPESSNDQIPPRQRSNINTFRKIAEITQGEFKDTDVREGKTYTYYAVAVDLAGRKSVKSNYYTHTVIGDAPSVTIKRPEFGETRYGSSIFLEYSVNDDLSDMLKVTLIMNNEKIELGYKKASSMLVYIYSMDIPFDGKHSIQLIVEDYAGQKTHSEQLRFKWYESEPQPQDRIRTSPSTDIATPVPRENPPREDGPIGPSQPPTNVIQEQPPKEMSQSPPIA